MWFIDKSQKRSVVDIRLKYSRLDPSYNLGNTANSWSGFASAQDVLAACMPAMDVILMKIFAYMKVMCLLMKE